MPVNLKVSIPKDTASPALRKIMRALGGDVARELNTAAARGAMNAAMKYHREFDRAGGWRGKRYLGPSIGEGTGWGAGVARGWAFVKATTKGATIANDADYYAFKVTGGTITAKRVSALTIPLVPEAVGLYASVYQQNTGRRLFTIKGRNALFERTASGGESTTGAGMVGRVRRSDGSSRTGKISRTGVRAVYALLKSVTMAPWPGAVPPDEVLLDAYLTAWRAEMAGIIESEP